MNQSGSGSERKREAGTYSFAPVKFTSNYANATLGSLIRGLPSMSESSHTDSFQQPDKSELVATMPRLASDWFMQAQGAWRLARA